MGGGDEGSFLKQRLSYAGSAFGGPARDLKDWQIIAIGGLAGALASIATTPAGEPSFALSGFQTQVATDGLPITCPFMQAVQQALVACHLALHLSAAHQHGVGHGM